MVEIATRGMAKILESADLDFVLIDMEHSAFDTTQVADLIAWLKATEIAPFVRVRGAYHFLARWVLDAGALGVMIGNVETPEQAKLIVDSVKYSPWGNAESGWGVAAYRITSVPIRQRVVEREYNRNRTDGVAVGVAEPGGDRNDAGCRYSVGGPFRSVDGDRGFLDSSNIRNS